MRGIALISISLGMAIAPLEAAPARWADATLPDAAGLELWFDATRENEAREAHFMNRLNDGQKAELWHDSSGHNRHLAQWSDAARPEWRNGSLHFDGGDFLAALLEPGTEIKDGTVFIVASPDRAGGDFPGLFSVAKRGENDYTSGLAIDQAKQATDAFAALNVEGAGQSGERSLMTKPQPFGKGHVLTVRTGFGGSELRVDGAAQGTRPRGQVAIGIDRVAVGARFVEPAMRHFYQGSIAEILVFSRKLDDAQTEAVERWLKAKHAAYLTDSNKSAAAAKSEAPLVQMLVPGFEVRELPVSVTNLNNIEYAPDGRLFAAGYDGRFHLLRDTDGDGLEDKLDTFSAETSDNYALGMVVKDGMPHMLLSDEIVRFRDTNNDGVPDKRESVVKGWDFPELQNDPLLMHRRVDSAMALAPAPDGGWYVTMGSANPGNGYWQKAEGDVWAPDAVKTGAPKYSPDKRRGCLLHLKKDGSIEQLCSGLRYIMSLQFDQHGELFATDQEGATWLPNGNPFDELLHLEKGRHYGFPPRHPKLLPNVIDEPSVWDYAPQHESACGFRFNGPFKDRPRFGPEFWANDAIVTGESRGKLWRTTIAKTDAGYIARNNLFACVSMLITDCAISPKGELVICCHAGPPDWGNGPSNTGKLFKIRYVDAKAPQPVLTYALDETKTVIEFDRALPKEDAQSLTERIHVTGGRYVTAGERFEAIRPGYAVVRRQRSEPSSPMPVKSATLSSDGRSIIVETAPRTAAVNYGITLDTPRNEAGIKQANAIDVAGDLTGVAAAWGDDDGSWPPRADSVGWGWLPDLDLKALEIFGRGSQRIAEAREAFAKPGAWEMRTRLDLSNLLQPKMQPGAHLDYTPQAETVTVTVRSDAAVKLSAGRGVDIATPNPNEASFTKTIGGDPWQDVVIIVRTPATRLSITWHTSLDPRERPMQATRFLMPFATRPAESTSTDVIPEIAGGNRENGHKLFMGKATCFLCHQFNGEGSAVGPDLSNTVHRDYASVLRDINEPSASINPDGVAYTVTLRDGSSVTGTRTGETADELRISMPGGTVRGVKKSEIASSQALTVSLMPPGLLAGLTDAERKDLLTYLLSAPQAEK